MTLTARRGDRALFAAAFVVMAGTSSLFPLLAPLQHAHHLSTAGLGLIAAGPYLFGFALQLATGRLTDRGHGYALLIAGLALTAVSSFGMALGTSLWEFVAARALAGAALAAFLPTARASAAVLDPRRAGHNMGRLSRAELCGLMAGPVGGAALAGAVGLSATFAIFGLTSVVAAVVAAPGLPRPRPLEPRTAGDARVGAVSLLRDTRVASAVLLVVAIEVPVGMFDSMWSRYLTDRGASSLFVGVSAVAFGLPFVVLTAAGGRLADRIGPARAATLASLAVVPIIAAYAIPGPPSMLVVFTVVEACFQAVAVPAARVAMAEACPPDRVAAGQGLGGAIGLAATGATALLCPPVYAAGGAAAMCVSVALVLAVIVAAAVALGARQNTSAF
jgi:predicted MFS family arabinose efflux permease